MKQKKNPTYCVAMSGGVDSSVTAYLLKKQGHNVFGLTMDLLPDSTSNTIKDAKTVADKLSIPHHFINLKKEFFKHVIKYFADSYLQGLTPSPCIICNKEIKLGLLAKKAVELGADYIVTGHYADIRETKNGIELHRAKDLEKDQSYFLFAIEKEVLQRLRCPLSGYSKEETRKLAKEANLEIHAKKDSQDICFVENGKYAELISQIHPSKGLKEGNIITKEGKILGKHKGIIHYTVGQRRGLGIGGGDILYVLEIDSKNNSVIVGSKEDLIKQKLTISNVNWLGESKPNTIDLMVKLRSRQELIPAKVKFLESDTAEVILKEKFFGVAPGQGCCFYQGTRVLGGGFINKNVT